MSDPFEKTNYVCHYRNLRYYLEKGLKVVKIYQILKFNQSPWLASYIDLNTKLRQEAKNKFSEGFAKLMNNSFFGKTCEDTRKHRKFTIALNEKKAIWLQLHYGFGCGSGKRRDFGKIPIVWTKVE